jgi:integrase
MARLSVPYLIQKGDLFYWQPSSAMRREGHRPRRLVGDMFDAVAQAKEINAAIAATHAPLKTDTLKALVARFKASAQWANLEARTATNYRRLLAHLPAHLLAKPVANISPAMLEAWLKGKRQTPAMHNALIAVLSVLFNFGGGNNPATKLPRARLEAADTLLWPEAAIAAFAEAAAAAGYPSIGQAVRLNSWLGQREADLLAATPAMVRCGTLVLRQRKTGARVGLPIGQVPGIGALPETGPALLLNERTGRPWTVDQFRYQFSLIRDGIAGLEFPLGYVREDGTDTVRLGELTFMRLRHTAVTRLAEAGCTHAEIAAVTGHSLSSVARILEHYLVSTHRLAANAFAKRLSLIESPSIDAGAC